jgi:polysaccharide export outer membrane protein
MRRLLALLAATALAAGCHTIDFYEQDLHLPSETAVKPPKELNKVSLPMYRIEPPDILQVELFKLVPKPPYHLEIYDVLQIDVVGTLLDQPIMGQYLIEAEGVVDLGPAYGKVRVAGMTVDEATRAITIHLKKILRRPEVSVRLLRSTGLQPIGPPDGQFIVGPDGTISLGVYGSVHVAGKTILEAKQVIEQHLSQYLDSPQVAVRVLAYNSKVYYIITEGAGQGDNVVRVPITGNETVLDAISNVGGLSQLSSKAMYIARPAPDDFHCEQVLPVDWLAISRGANTATNYQILPGDRLFIEQDTFVAWTNELAKVIGPFERLAAFGSLGASTVRTFQTLGRNFNRNRGGGF